MAIDKNSKAYQSLLNKGYSDDQITQMYNSASSGQSRQEVVNNTQPVNTPTTNYQNQGSGSYTFNKDTGYYENTTNTSKNTTNQGMVAKQETATPIKQQETQGSTVGNIQQQGAMKPKSEEYYNQTGDEAQNQIRDNLNRYRQTNPEYFSNYEDFKKNFSYDSRNEEQRNTLDQWYKGYEKGVQLGAVPVNDLYTQYNNGDISQSDLETLRIYNPEKYAELQNQINKGAIIAAYDDDKGLDTTGKTLQEMAYDMAVQTFASLQDSSNGASKYFREYEEKMDSPEMMGLSDKTTELQEEIKNIQDQISTITKDVEKEYEGTGATKSKINAIAADRTYDLQQQLRTLNNEYEKYAMQYNNRMQQYQNEFNMQLQEYQLGVQERNQKMSELGFALDLMNFETNEQKQQREWDYWVKQQEYTNGNINSSDYQTRYKAALKSVQNLLSQYQWIPMKRSAEQMAQDILTAIDNGSNLGAELTKINKQIQEKPEYKQLYNQTFGIGGFGNQVVIGGQEYVEYDGNLYTAEEFNKKFGGNKANYTVVSDDKLKTYSDGREGTFGSFINKPKNNDGNSGGQCGKYANDYLEEIGAGRPFGDEDIETREGWINSQEGKVGTIAIFDYGQTSSDGVNHGHVAIVISKPDKNGDLWVKDSNFDKDGIIHTRRININDASLKGFFDPSKPNGAGEGTGTTTTKGTTKTTSTSGTTSSSTTETTTNPDNTKLKAEAMLKQIKTGNMTPSETSNAREWLIENGYGEEFLDALDKGIKVSLTDTQKSLYEYGMNTYKNSDVVKDFKDASTQISNLITSLNANNGSGDLAGIFEFMKVLDPSSVVREGEFKQAAKSAGYLNPDSLWQNYVKHGWDGTWLTEAQRGNFKELAKNLIKSQAEMYNIEYSDLKKVFENAGIDSQWLPTNYAEVIINKLDGKSVANQQAQSQWNSIVGTATPNKGKRRGNRSNTISVGNGQTITWN